jgi:hypothetical protein
MRLRKHDVDISPRCRRQRKLSICLEEYQMEEDTTLCRKNRFLRSYSIPTLDEQMEGCALSKGDSLCFHKRKYFSLPLFGVYLIFFVFLFLKKNERMLRYKGGLSFADILVPSERNTWMLREKGHL